MDGFEGHVARFFACHLPDVKGASPNTVASYRDAIVQFVSFASGRFGKAVEALGVEDLGGDALGEFLDHLERSRGVAVSTRNHRLAAARSLFRYIQARDPVWMETTDRKSVV